MWDGFADKIAEESKGQPLAFRSALYSVLPVHLGFTHLLMLIKMVRKRTFKVFKIKAFNYV